MSKSSLLTRYFAFLQRRLTGDRFIFHLILIVMIGSLLMLGLQINNHYAKLTPTPGGTLVEGIVGTPRFVNPVLAITRADLDMVQLVYSGLMKVNPNGDLVPDLAESVTVSPDGRTYHVKLRHDRYFSDGSPVTAKDVAYTIGLIQNADLKSPLRGNWDGVLVEELGDYELNIVLKEPYAPFMENLTVGILPRSIWDQLPTEQLPFSQHNTEPIGSGPYYVSGVSHNKSGLINGYTLKASPYAAQKPKIETLSLRFFENEDGLIDALNEGEVHGTPSLSAAGLKKVNLSQYTELEKPLPRVFGLFFNQNKSTALRDKAVREALDVMIDRSTLVTDVLQGHGIPTTSPVPPGFLGVQSTSTTPTSSPEKERLAAAKKILTDGGWSQADNGTWSKTVGKQTTPLDLTISTANTDLFSATAQKVETWWKDLGVTVNVDQYEQADLVQTVIRPRDYQVLLFGNDVGRAIDLYPFWHSSQKDDPGLNITQYTNIDTDALLEKIRTATTTKARDENVTKFTTIIANEKPALFLFTPTFTYLIDKKVTVDDMKRLGSPSDRFANISDWYISNQRLWPIFQSDR